MVLATWFGAGYFPWGPGTAGSLAAILIFWLLHAWLGVGQGTLLAMVLIGVAPAIWSAGVTARHVGTEDPGIVVIDEVLGQWLTLAGATTLNWKSFLIGFILFRVFDIWKPWPVSQLEKLPGGIGIVADDLAAGVFGALMLYIGGALKLY